MASRGVLCYGPRVLTWQLCHLAYENQRSTAINRHSLFRWLQSTSQSRRRASSKWGNGWTLHFVMVFNLRYLTQNRIIPSFWLPRRQVMLVDLWMLSCHWPYRAHLVSNKSRLSNCDSWRGCCHMDMWSLVSIKWRARYVQLSSLWESALQRKNSCRRGLTAFIWWNDKFAQMLNAF